MGGVTSAWGTPGVWKQDAAICARDFIMTFMCRSNESDGERFYLPFLYYTDGIIHVLLPPWARYGAFMT